MVRDLTVEVEGVTGGAQGIDAQAPQQPARAGDPVAGPAVEPLRPVAPLDQQALDVVDQPVRVVDLLFRHDHHRESRSSR